MQKSYNCRVKISLSKHFQSGVWPHYAKLDDIQHWSKTNSIPILKCNIMIMNINVLLEVCSYQPRSQGQVNREIQLSIIGTQAMANFTNSNKTAVSVEKTVLVVLVWGSLSHCPSLMASQPEDESLGHRTIRPGIFNTQLSLSPTIPLFL